MTNCVIQTRSVLRSVYDHFFDTGGGAPGLAKLNVDEIHQFFDPSQDGWGTFDQQLSVNNGVDISATPTNVDVIPSNSGFVHYIDGLQVSFSIAGTVAVLYFAIMDPSDVQVSLSQLRQIALNDIYYFTPSSSMCSNTAVARTEFPPALPIIMLPPNYGLRLQFTGGIATSEANITLSFRRAPVGAKIGAAL